VADEAASSFLITKEPKAEEELAMLGD